MYAIADKLLLSIIHFLIVGIRIKVEILLFVGARLGFQPAAELWIVNKIQVNCSPVDF